MNNFSIKLNEYAKTIENAFDSSIICFDTSYEKIREAMLYSLKIGGKRIRPIILLEFYKLCGKDDDNALKFAVALEMIHTYSLIHDDLPCMDDDDFRRGKPSCHKVYGEGMAVLAGDALLTEAFNLAAQTTGIPQDRVVKALSVLAGCAGINGMIGGQVVDTDNFASVKDIDALKKMHILKTGALIKCAAQIGCILAGREDLCLYAQNYAEKIGLAFQIVDDILDVIGDEKLLGKPISSDSKNDKTTFVTLLGLDKCKAEVDRLTNEAKNELGHFDGDVSFILELSNYLASRNF